MNCSESCNSTKHELIILIFSCRSVVEYEVRLNRLNATCAINVCTYIFSEHEVCSSLFNKLNLRGSVLVNLYYYCSFVHHVKKHDIKTFSFTHVT